MSKKKYSEGGRYFPQEEYDERRERVRRALEARGLDACLIASPENVYYLTGLSHQGYFAYQMLLFPREGSPVLITRAMERAMVRDQVPDVTHVGYSDGAEELPPPSDRESEFVLGQPTDSGRVFGLEPWSASYGMPSRPPEVPESGSTAAPIKATVEALENAGLAKARLGIEKTTNFFPFAFAEGIVAGLPKAQWIDASGLVDELRIVQSPLELQLTREAARISDSMMLSAIAAAGPGVYKRDIMAAVYDALFRRDGTYPGFIPLVRSSRTIEHEHGTWHEGRLRKGDVLFVELAGCRWRYHAPMGRLVFIDRLPPRNRDIHTYCQEAMARAIDTIRPGVKAREVYSAWQSRISEAGLNYHRHHCGYAVGIGFPPSWSGSGVPIGLRRDSDMELKSGMVFHLMSWLLRTGRGDSFLSDTVVVTDEGSEILTNISRDLHVR